MRAEILKLRTEVDCRIEHGANSGGHLEYVRAELDKLLALPWCFEQGRVCTAFCEMECFLQDVTIPPCERGEPVAARVPSESEGDEELWRALAPVFALADSACHDEACQCKKDLARARELVGIRRSRLSSVTEGSVEESRTNETSNLAGGSSPVSSAGPEVLPHVPDTAGEVNPMPGVRP